MVYKWHPLSGIGLQQRRCEVLKFCVPYNVQVMQSIKKSTKLVSIESQMNQNGAAKRIILLA